MTDELQTIRDDLAFIRQMAEQGRRGPLLGGSILALAGASFGLAAVAHWAIIREVVDVPRSWLIGVWLVATVIFYAGLILTKRKLATQAGAEATNSRLFGAVWAGLGGALFTVFVGFAAASMRSETALPMNLFATVVLALYGSGWMVAQQISGRRWLFGVGLASFSAAFVLAFLADHPDQFLAYAAALFLLALVPGLILMRTEPAERI